MDRCFVSSMDHISTVCIQEGLDVMGLPGLSHFVFKLDTDVTCLDPCACGASILLCAR